MSYAAAARSHIDELPPPPAPDPSLLEGTHTHAASAGDQEEEPHGNVHVVDQKEARQMRSGIEHADEVDSHPREMEIHPTFQPQPPKEKQEAVQNKIADVENKAQRGAKDVENKAQRVGNEAQRAGKDLADEAERTGKDIKKEAKSVGRDLEDKADDLVEKTQEVAEDAAEKGREYAKKAEKKGAEWKREAEQEAKKLGKKAEQLDKDARAAARRHPQAATGIVGAVNLAIIATAGFVVYNNWDKPRWDRRAVTAGVVGLLAIFGAEGALGYYEVEQDKKERGRL